MIPIYSESYHWFQCNNALNLEDIAKRKIRAFIASFYKTNQTEIPAIKKRPYCLIFLFPIATGSYLPENQIQTKVVSSEGKI